MIFKAFVFSFAILIASSSFADIVSAPRQKVENLRVEGVAGLIGFSNNPSSTECTSRFWVDLNDEVDRIKFSVAMMAFSAGKEVLLRADTSKTKAYGACRLYDIFVYP